MMDVSSPSVLPVIRDRSFHKRVFVRKPALDRLLIGSRVFLALHPIELPSVEALRDAFIKLATSVLQRLAFVESDAMHWEILSAAGMQRRREEFVRTVPEEQRASAQEWLADNLITDLPVQVGVSGSHLVIAYDHSLFDGRVVTVLPKLLIDTAQGEAVMLPGQETSRPLARALARTLGLRPRAWFTLFRDIRDHRSQPASNESEPTTNDQERRISLVGSPSAIHHVHGSCDAKTMRAILQWARPRGLPGADSLLLLAAAGLEHCGIPTAPRGSLVVDLRRYLPPGVDTTGNFITGTLVPLRRPAEQGRTRDIATTLDSGRPLAATAIKVARERLRPRAAAELPVYRADVTVPRPGRAVVSMSSFGISRELERLPWQAGPESHAIRVHTDAVDIDAVGFIAVSLRHRTYMSATFRADVFDPRKVARAIELMFDDPIPLLDSAMGTA